jgi:hypothetical protein
VIKSRRIGQAEHKAHMGNRKAAHRFLVGKTEVKSPLGRPRHRWDNINMDLQQIGAGRRLNLCG